MTDNTFLDIINTKNIRIPKIQRDYAQGRKAPKVNEIRKNFVHSLMKTVKGEVSKQELDFVYGNERNKAFEPLDGQQRLTTLFLLHWILDVDLKNSELDSKFTYETRPTSKAFCDELVKHSADAYIKQAIELQKKYETEETNENIKKQKVSNVLSEIITRHDWFQWLWKFDPTVQSMLVMLNSLYKEIGFYPDNIENDTLALYRKNLSNITFNFLNLDDLKMSDELFIKMNARGKQLSDFDIVKSSLEEEIQIQKKMKLLSETTEENWRNYMDGEWIDFFWQKYASPILEIKDISDEEKHAAVIRTEFQFKKLLIRLIALEILQKASEDLSDCTNSERVLIESCYNFDEWNLDNILNAYNDYWLEKDRKDKYRINFCSIIETVNNIIYKDSGNKIKELSLLIPVDYRFDYKEKENSYLDLFLGIYESKDLIACFYCFIKYINEYPLISQLNLIASEEEKIYLYDWMRIMRNIIKIDNNNVRIDKIVKLVNTMKGVDSLFQDFIDYCKNNSDASVVNFFAQLNKEYKGLDNSSLKEEVAKAKLITSEKGIEWNSVLLNAEQNYYLWGQIRCILNWSSGDLEKFKSYESKLTELLDSLKDNNENTGKFYAAIITESDYWKDKNRMYIFTADRDYSIKRYLRDEELKENGFYASSLKALIDNWLLPENKNKSSKEYLDSIIQTRLKTEVGWKKCILNDNSILDYSYWKTIFITEKNHVLIGKNKTQDSHCIDPCLLFIKHQLDASSIESILNDSQAEPPNSLDFSINNIEYEIKWGNESGAFEIKQGDSLNNYSSDEEMLNYISNIIEQIETSNKE